MQKHTQFRFFLVLIEFLCLVFFAFPTYANVVDEAQQSETEKELILEDKVQNIDTKTISILSVEAGDSISKSNLFKSIIKNNNKEFLKQKRQEESKETVVKDSIIQNIKKQELLDINDDKTLSSNSSDESWSQNLSKLTAPTSIWQIKKYWGFKWYQQALLSEVTYNAEDSENLDKTLNSLQIQELTQKYWDINNQYLQLVQRKKSNDWTFRQLLLSMKLTKRSISETLDSINKRALKIRLLESETEETKKELRTTLPDLLEAEDDLIRYTQTFYKMNHDIFKNDHQISNIKLFTKADNIAETLASDLIVKDLTQKIDELIQEISKRRIKIMITHQLYDSQLQKLKEEKLIYQQEKETLYQQIENYEEFMIYVKSNKAYIDQKKSELEKEKITLWQEKEIINLLNNASTAEELKEIRERLSVKLDDETMFFEFPIAEIKKVTSFFEDESYNQHFGVDHHYALDFRLAQWSYVHAPADGYVYKIINQNSSMLNWFIVLHRNNLATVYLHMQDIFVQPWEYIKRWDIMWLSGWTPGTRWAWHMTTWPHLHREVWKDAKVVDPLLYTDLSVIKEKNMLQQRHYEKWDKDNDLIE